jgi:hypothetical protein
MNKPILSIFVLLGFITVLTMSLVAADTPKYVGAKKCKMCHMSKKRGDQWGIWEDSKHSKAYETLANEHSKKVAKEEGISGDPQKADQCLKCHVTAHGVAASKKESSFSMEEGVGCEACHGPGSEYKGMKVMKDLAAGKVEPKTVGFIPGKKETCLGCHNEESPTYKPFKYEEDYKKIAHPTPED